MNIALLMLGITTLGAQVSFAADNGYTPKGIHMGSFYLYPVVEAGVGYDDNVFRLPDDVSAVGSDGVAAVDSQASDTAVTARASITANSDWSRHAINGLASVDLGKYSEYSSEDFGNYLVGADGRLDIKRDINVTGKIGIQKQNESRSSVDSREGYPGTPVIYGAEPTQVHSQYIGAAFDYRPARFGVRATVDYQQLDYDDVTNVFGNNVDNSDRDRARSDASLRLDYEIMPQRRLYVEGAVNNVDYDRITDNSGIERNSSGFKGTAGINFDLNNLLLGDVYFGYIERNYDSPEQADISSNLLGMGLQWFPTRLTSVDLGLDKRIEESTEATASGYLSTMARIGVNHELKRNIILTADADYTKNEFQQNEPGQKENENIQGYGLKGKYMFSRLWYTSLRYRYESRDSDIKLQEYTNNRALFTLGANW